MKPLIGLTGYYLDQSETGKNRQRGLPGQDMAMFSYDYARSIERAGGIPVMLPILEPSSIGKLLERLDGLLFAGGADVNPLHYGEAPKAYLGSVEEERDTFELLLAGQALLRDMPIFGICRGLQILNVAQGGSLYQDLQQEMGPEHFHAHEQYRKWQATHTVRISPQSRLYQAVGQSELMVNSYHHQGIKLLGNGFAATAHSADGVIEAIESQTHRFVVAVQWHPEMMSEKHPLQQQLFDSFIRQVRNRCNVPA
ncbi:gamma-glutamyl-gamma-aminobutyrate hydrolase family protein [Fodinisporobacter ferrooxydans]|uniref:Gamma-glutamyl-gamma-aminobutyrate hydrolase family protein n=1 Tax=Fodinisporobacter ferrooxydans TaxID=2901836 RepID=A0ABY4CPY3_9BACL|nr:gamma-glutamyl-gamma-aminobutyrate hydrolase family protein [Alicyclobacillaceae bacterium MYW30-H2]